MIRIKKKIEEAKFMAANIQTHDRRYISSKELAAYVLFDSSKSFNIGSYDGRFFLDVVKIDLAWNAAGGILRSAWDIINDFFAGVLVDKTNTRYGKFKPYLLAVAIPGTLFALLKWFTPYFFDDNPQNVGKFIFWLALGMANELNGTFHDFAETGFISSMTPNPRDRTRMFTMAEVISALWESIPQVLMGVIVDLVNHKKINISMQSAYVGMGSMCALAAGLCGVLFATVCKERIAQSVERPSVRDGLKTILNNRPMLLIILSDLMKVFKLDTGTQNYYIDVLGAASISNIILLPGMPLSLWSYTFIGKVQERFSTKALWIFGDHERDVTSILVFLFGLIGGRGKGGFYNKVKYMLPVLMAKDVVYKGTLSIFKIVPRTMQLEALDYCEWKNGYRTEGTTLAAKNIVKKLIGATIGPFSSLILKQIGYSLKAGFGQQSQTTKFYLFALCTLLPGATGLLGVIPKLFYRMTPAEHERMYEELHTQRAARSEKVLVEGIAAHG